MELREFAQQVLRSSALEDKLRPPLRPFSDHQPGDPLRLKEPARPPRLQFAPRRTAPEFPAPGALRRPEKRALAHHIMANHELQALEIMAWVLLAFPAAPGEFRAGLAEVMCDEQRHTRMHVERAARLGLEFGAAPVNCYIWKKAMAFTCVLDYLAGLPLFFEAGNLDHSLELAQAFVTAGDERSAALMRTIHQDEIEHVRFGLDWLRKLKSPQQSDWEAFASHLHWPLRPGKARGDAFQRAARRAAGMDEEFVQRLEKAHEEESRERS
jgi:uncharacterized ferritin-like protein (DUF455 family)